MWRTQVTAVRCLSSFVRSRCVAKLWRNVRAKRFAFERFAQWNVMKNTKPFDNKSAFYRSKPRKFDFWIVLVRVSQRDVKFSSFKKAVFKCIDGFYIITLFGTAPTRLSCTLRSLIPSGFYPFTASVVRFTYNRIVIMYVINDCSVGVAHSDESRPN